MPATKKGTRGYAVALLERGCEGGLGVVAGHHSDVGKAHSPVDTAPSAPAQAGAARRMGHARAGVVKSESSLPLAVAQAHKVSALPSRTLLGILELQGDELSSERTTSALLSS